MNEPYACEGEQEGAKLRCHASATRPPQQRTFRLADSSPTMSWRGKRWTDPSRLRDVRRITEQSWQGICCKSWIVSECARAHCRLPCTFKANKLHGTHRVRKRCKAVWEAVRRRNARIRSYWSLPHLPCQVAPAVKLLVAELGIFTFTYSRHIE